MRQALITAVAILAACGLIALGGWAARAAASPAAQRERAPECHKIALLAPSGRAAWVVFCGSGPGAESPLADWLGAPGADRKVIMDGTRVISPAACPRANPCVMIADGSPPS